MSVYHYLAGNLPYAKRCLALKIDEAIPLAFGFATRWWHYVWHMVVVPVDALQSVSVDLAAPLALAAAFAATSCSQCCCCAVKFFRS